MDSSPKGVGTARVHIPQQGVCASSSPFESHHGVRVRHHGRLRRIAPTRCPARQAASAPELRRGSSPLPWRTGLRLRRLAQHGLADRLGVTHQCEQLGFGAGLPTSRYWVYPALVRVRLKTSHPFSSPGVTKRGVDAGSTLYTCQRMPSGAVKVRSAIRAGPVASHAQTSHSRNNALCRRLQSCTTHDLTVRAVTLVTPIRTPPPRPSCAWLAGSSPAVAEMHVLGINPGFACLPAVLPGSNLQCHRTKSCRVLRPNAKAHLVTLYFERRAGVHA